MISNTRASTVHDLIHIQDDEIGRKYPGKAWVGQVSTMVQALLTIATIITGSESEISPEAVSTGNGFFSRLLTFASFPIGSAFTGKEAGSM